MLSSTMQFSTNNPTPPTKTPKHEDPAAMAGKNQKPQHPNPHKQHPTNPTRHNDAPNQQNTCPRQSEPCYFRTQQCAIR